VFRNVFGRPLRRDLPRPVMRFTCVAVDFPAFGYAFPCALSYTHPRVPCYICHPYFAVGFPIPLLMSYTMGFHWHFVICSLCMLRVHKLCVLPISRAFRYTLFHAFLHTQPGAFPFGFLVISVHSLWVPHVLSHSLRSFIVRIV